MKKKFQSSTGPKGLAPSVRMLKAGVKIVDEDGGEYGPFPFDRVNERNGLKEVLEAAEWSSLSDMYFSLNRNEDFLYDLHPYEGFHNLRFQSIQSRKDKPPTFRTRTDQWGNRRIEFTVVFEIVGGKFAGMVVPKSFPYIFAEDPDSGMTILHGTSGQISDVEKMLVLSGFTEPDDDIEYSDNVLPELEECLLGHNEVFGGTLENGWVQSLSSVDEDLRPEAPPR